MRLIATGLACVFWGLFTLGAVRAEEAPIVGDWRVDQLDGGPLQKGSSVTLRFGADGRVSGKASCNRYGATYHLDGARVSFSEAVATRMACAPPLMNQEQRFLSIFDAGATWAISRDTLTISASNGVIVRAKRATSE